MSQRTNAFWVGIFAVAGTALLVAALMLFGSARLFSKAESYVLYFDQSLHGLQVGAPVKFRGVTIGEVKEILIHFNQATNDVAMPVRIEVAGAAIDAKSDRILDLADEAAFAALVARGLRGQLEAESYVTGRLYVDLRIVPDARPPVWHQVLKLHREIPTNPTQIQELMASLAKVDLGRLSEKLDSILGKLENRLAELEVATITAGVTNLLSSLNRLAQAPEITNMLASSVQTLNEIRTLAIGAQAKLSMLADRVDGALGTGSQTLEEARRTMREVRDTLSPHGELRRELSPALQQMGEAAQSIAALAEFLERHPNALISGRKRSEAKP